MTFSDKSIKDYLLEKIIEIFLSKQSLNSFKYSNTLASQPATFRKIV